MLHSLGKYSWVFYFMFYLERFDLIQFRPIGAVGEIINMKQVHSQGSIDRVFWTEFTKKVKQGEMELPLSSSNGPLIPR